MVGAAPGQVKNMKQILIAALLVLLAGCAHGFAPPAPPIPYTMNCPESHPVKGNISERSRIFHTKYSSWYNKTSPEICFKTIEDASNAGFVPPRKIK